MQLNLRQLCCDTRVCPVLYIEEVLYLCKKVFVLLLFAGFATNTFWGKIRVDKAIYDVIWSMRVRIPTQTNAIK